MSANQLLAEIDVFPDHGSVLINDAGDAENTSWVDISHDDQSEYAGEVWASDHTIQVSTISEDSAQSHGRNVTVRVYRGDKPDGLGYLIYSGTLDLVEPALAIGQLLVGKEFLQRVELGGAGPTTIQIYGQNAIPTIYDLPTDLNILIPNQSAV